MPWKRLDATEEDARWFRANAPRTIRYLLDENMDPDLGDYLRGRGHNVLTAEAAGLLKRGDDEVYAYARKEDRVILTCDPDFLDDRRHSPVGHPPSLCSALALRRATTWPSH